MGPSTGDIKPANVLIDEDGRPTLSDFGLTRMMEGSAGLTAGGAVLGTPEYMAPEQALGKPADQRSDLYALGILVYQMLLGRTPFLGETPPGTLMAHIHQPVPLPSAVDPDFDPRLEAVLLRVLAKDPDERYQTADELMEAINGPTTGEQAVMEPKTGDKGEGEVDFGSEPTLAGEVVEGQTIAGPMTSAQQPAEKRDTFDAAGEFAGYISLDQARVRAMRSARESPGEYGDRYADVPMAFEVEDESETEDHYVITLAFRPQGSWVGTPGREQFFIEKEGTVAHRQVLGLPATEGKRRLPIVPIAIGGVAVVIVAIVAAVVVGGGGGGGGRRASRSGAWRPRARSGRRAGPAAFRGIPGAHPAGCPSTAGADRGRLQRGGREGGVEGRLAGPRGGDGSASR